MAVHFSHAGLPYPIYGYRYTVGVTYTDGAGDPTDPVTPDTEISKDGAAFADCVEEVSVVSTGFGLMTFTAEEMSCNLAMVAFKSEGAPTNNGPLTTQMVLYPRRLRADRTGTAQAGASSAITLDAGHQASSNFWDGVFIGIDAGTGLGQIRLCTAYDGATNIAAVVPAWETVPDETSEYTIHTGENSPVVRNVRGAVLGGGLDAPVGLGVWAANEAGNALAGAVLDELLASHVVDGSLGGAFSAANAGSLAERLGILFHRFLTASEVTEDEDGNAVLVVRDAVGGNVLRTIDLTKAASVTTLEVQP